MSPAALGGPPHTRASSLYGGGPISTEKASKINGVDGMGGVNRVLPHLDDLVSVKPDINVQSPLQTILKKGIELAKSAATSLDFHRPEFALKDFIKASIIAVEIVPHHKDYPSIANDREDLRNLYQTLTKRIRDWQARFDDVKQQIKENNARSGVQPTSIGRLPENLHDKSNGVAIGHARTQSTTLVNGSLSNGASSHTVTPAKKKPPIQPKPNALHGKVLHPENGSLSPDLAARFARLRSAESNGVVQDPRIRTQPISIPEHLESGSSSPVSSHSQSNNYTISRPTGPREMPSVPKTAPRPKLFPLDVPSMPRPPDPIYNSPARNNDTTSTANLPSSVPRNSSYLGHARKDSAPPISTVGPTPGPMDDRQDYFVPAHSVNGYSGLQKTRPDINIPDSTTITAEKLYEYIKLGSQTLRLLLVDIRIRAQFDSGHIMSPAIICVEPMSLGHGGSAEDLGERLVLAPDSEQALYNKREEFDLVVCYDQSSTSFESSGPSGDRSYNALNNFSTAVYEYGYDKRLKRRPMILVRGLDAWIDLLGPNSLQSSWAGTQSSVTPSGTQKQSTRPLGRVPMARNRRVPPPVPRRVESRPFTKDEENKWDEVLKNDEVLGSPSEGAESDDFFYARTTEDFMRRFPEVSNIQESMVSIDTKPMVQSPISEDFVDHFPKAPARPPPALPRQRSSGISERGAVVYTPAHAASTTPGQLPNDPGLTGLVNPGNLCYLNASIQLLASIPFLRNFLMYFEHPQSGNVVPRKQNESSRPPQLMVRNLKNVFYFMWTGKFDFLNPKTFVKYVNAVHIGSTPPGTARGEAFGGTRQHDASEFLTWIGEILEDETNPHRAVLEVKQNQAEKDAAEIEMLKLPRFTAAQYAWQNVLKHFDSPITHHMKGQFGYFKQCRSCGHESRMYIPFNQLELVIPRDENGIAPTEGKLVNWLQRDYGDEPDVTVSCDNCQKLGRPHTDRRKKSQVYFTHLPDYLVINIKRFDFHGSAKKIDTSVTLPQRPFSLDFAFLPDEPGLEFAQLPMERGQRKPFNYEVVAAVHHVGASPSSGHYWTVARHVDAKGKAAGWNRFDDNRVLPVGWNQVGGNTAYIVLLRREGTHDGGRI